MGVLDKLTADLKSAMLARESEKIETLRGLKSAVLYEEVALKKRDSGLSDDEVIAVLKREAKKRNDAIALYRQGRNEASALKEEAELDIICQYLPEMLDETTTLKLVEEAMSELGIEVVERSDTGRIIGIVKKKAGTSADPAVIAKIVNQKIG